LRTNTSSDKNHNIGAKAFVKKTGITIIYFFCDMNEPSAISRIIIVKQKYLIQNSKYRLIASEMIAKCTQCEEIKACAEPNKIIVADIQAALDAAKTVCDVSQARCVTVGKKTKAVYT
jgi:hypothetical protein